MNNAFIENAIASKRSVRVITINGFQLCGVIVRDSLEAIELDCGKDGRKYIYKHAISTIV